MKYVIIVDDDDIKNFRCDDDGLTLVVIDKTYCTRAFRMKPVIKPLVVFPHYMPVDEQSEYITTGHIAAMREYARQQGIKDHFKRFHDIIEGKYDTIKQEGGTDGKQR